MRLLRSLLSTNLIAPFYNIHVPVTIDAPNTAFPDFYPTTFSTIIAIVRTTPLATLECFFSWSIPDLKLQGEGTLEIPLEL